MPFLKVTAYLPEDSKTNLWTFQGVEIVAPGSEDWTTERILDEATSKARRMLVERGVVPPERAELVHIQVTL